MMLFETNLSVIPVSKHFETTDVINQDNILPTDDTNQENILMTDDTNQDNFLPDSFKSRQVVEQVSNITVLCDMSDSPESNQPVNQVQSFLCDTLADELIPTNCESSQIVKQVSSSTLLCDSETDELLECPESSYLMNQVSNRLLLGDTLPNDLILERSGSSQSVNQVRSSTIICDIDGNNESLSQHVHVSEQQKVNSEDNANDTFITTLEKKCKCIYTNADQLQNKLDELKVYISLLNADFIFITEVLPQLNADSLSCASMIYHIDGYNAFPSTDNGRGVIIYAKEDFNIRPKQNICVVPVARPCLILTPDPKHFSCIQFLIFFFTFRNVRLFFR